MMMMRKKKRLEGAISTSYPSSKWNTVGKSHKGRRSGTRGQHSWDLHTRTCPFIFGPAIRNLVLLSFCQLFSTLFCFKNTVQITFRNESRYFFFLCDGLPLFISAGLRCVILVGRSLRNITCQLRNKLSTSKTHTRDCTYRGERKSFSFFLKNRLARQLGDDFRCLKVYSLNHRALSLCVPSWWGPGAGFPRVLLSVGLLSAFGLVSFVITCVPHHCVHSVYTSLSVKGRRRKKGVLIK